MKADLRAHAVEQASTLLGRLAFQVHRVSKLAEPDPIHDLRVSIRRFAQCLRVFAPFFPEKPSKRVRRRLRSLMNTAAEVRNRDIALALLQEAGLSPGSAFIGILSQERKQAKRDLQQLVKRWNKRNFSQKWRSKLEL